MIWKGPEFIELLLKDLLPALGWRTPEHQEDLITTLVRCNIVSGTVSARRIRSIACQAAEHFHNSILKVEPPQIVSAETVSIGWLSHWLLDLGVRLIYGRVPQSDDRLFRAIGSDEDSFHFFKDRLLLSFLKALERSTFGEQFEGTAKDTPKISVGSVLSTLNTFEITIRPHALGRSPAIVESSPPDDALRHTLEVIAHDLLPTHFEPIAITIGRTQEVHMDGILDDHRGWLLQPALEHAQRFFTATAAMPSVGDYFRVATNVVYQLRRSKLPVRSTVTESQKVVVCNHCLDLQIQARQASRADTINTLGIQFNGDGPHRIIVPYMECGLSPEQIDWLAAHICAAQQELILNIAPLVNLDIHPDYC